MSGLLALFVVVMGAGLSAQPLLNARVGAAAGHPVWAALFSVLVSSLTLLVVSQLLRLPAPRVLAADCASCLDILPSLSVSRRLNSLGRFSSSGVMKPSWLASVRLNRSLSCAGQRVTAASIIITAAAITPK